MKRFVVGLVAAAVVVSMAGPAMAQSKTVRSEMRTETGTIEAIEASTRTVTLKKADGTFVTTVAGPDIARFAELKLGDTVNVRYYDNVVIRVKQPGESDVISGAKGTTGSEQVLPGGTRAKQVTITASIAALDPSTPSITFTGPKAGSTRRKCRTRKLSRKSRSVTRSTSCGQKRCWCRSSAASRRLVDGRGGPP